jgi:hypothetical protein
MPHGKNTLVDRDEGSTIDPPLNEALPAAQGDQLPTRDYPMLPFGELPDCPCRLEPNLATTRINFSSYFMEDLMRTCAVGLGSRDADDSGVLARLYGAQNATASLQTTRD